MDHHVKSINTDSRSTKRLRFASSKERSKNVSADVYRVYKRRINVTSAASREERVHHPHREETRQRKRHRFLEGDETHGKKAILQTGESTSVVAIDDADKVDVSESTFSEELDLAHDRNASETFRNCYRELWPLSRSLPEVLHHAAKIVTVLLEYILSDANEPHVKSTLPSSATKERGRFILNHATADCLHLLSVLAKDLRTEIHPFLHSQILPRIVADLLNQPTTITVKIVNDDADEVATDEKQCIPVDVSIIEAAFRCISYLFRYDAEALLQEDGGCLESLRPYYGTTLAHRRDVVRRLAAETFAPLIRKLKNVKSQKRHLRRVLRALLMTSSCDNGINMTNSALKLQSNAIDGISQLFMEVARGVAGQLHSKGGKVATTVVLDMLVTNRPNDDPSEKSRKLLQSVSSVYIQRVCHHIHRRYGREILQPVLETTKRVLNESSATDSSSAPLEDMIRLLHQLVLFRDGTYLQHHSDENKFRSKTELIQVLRQLLEVLVPKVSNLSATLQSKLLQIFCAFWKAIPNDPQMAKLAEAHLKSMIYHPNKVHYQEEQHPAILLASNLMPHLPATLSMGIVGSLILSAAARMNDVEERLSLIRAVAMCKHSSDIDNDIEHEYNHHLHLNEPFREDRLFFLDQACYCRISEADKDSLLQACLLDVHETSMDPARIGLLGFAAQCAPFISLAGIQTNEDDCTKDDEQMKKIKMTLEGVLKWLLKAFKSLAERSIEHSSKKERSDSTDVCVVAASLALEGLALLAKEIKQKKYAGDASTKKLFVQAKGPCEALILAQPASHWTLRATSAYAQALNMWGQTLNEREEILQSMIPNLRNESHYSRLYSLQIICSFPKKPFVTDHADLDLTDDMDEEPVVDARFQSEQGKSGMSVRSDLCNILDTMLAIELAPLAFERERHLLSLISRVEILGRTARLPVAYTEAAANHMLGILYRKYSPVWQAAVKAFVSLANGQKGDFVWAPLKKSLTKLMNRIPSERRSIDSPFEYQVETSTLSFSLRNHSHCLCWDRSNGVDCKIFGQDVSQHLPTDESTVLQHLWSVFERAPQLLTKNSRHLVPVFLQFMHSQFYSYYSHDPEARELSLDRYIDDKTRFSRDLLQRHIIQQRLISILKAFAAVKGPQQLFKHKVVLSIVMSLLCQDSSIAKYAFSCIQTYKLPCLTLFSESIEALFAKGGLNEGLLKLTTSLETHVLDRAHKQSLIPILMRVLFGRLTARVGGNKSSKDSPSGRRSAVLSFLAILCKREEDIYPFIYLMIRNYVPRKFQLLPVEHHSTAIRSAILSEVKTMSTSDLACLPTQVHLGFLHLVEPVVKQFGHRILRYVDQLTCILIALCKFAEIKRTSNIDIDGNNCHSKTVGDSEETSTGGGSIRMLCFRRLSEIFDQFSGTVDFCVYGSSMWDSIEHSVANLPTTVVHCERVPALLNLMVTLASHNQLAPLLGMVENAVPCVVKCLADTSTQPVVDSTLSFIDHLLVYDEMNEAPKHKYLIQGHIELVLHQFMIRLGSKASSLSSDESLNKTAKTYRKLNRSSTWRRELQILCRITDMIEHSGSTLDDAPPRAVPENLCRLLVPFLDLGNGVAEADQLNVLKILEALIPDVGPEAGTELFQVLAELLGPVKGRPGIVAIPIREGLASVIGKTPLISHTQASTVSEVLQRLCRSHAKRVDEMDYDVVIPALSSLTATQGDTSWIALAEIDSGFDPNLILPLVFTCFHYLFNEDGVVSRGSFKALKHLIATSALQAGFLSEATSGSNASLWHELLEKSLIPVIRTGLTSRNTGARRFFILLIAEVARTCKGRPEPNLYGDIGRLIRDDNQDLDFFLNITHVQLHRRTRAFQRIRKLLAAQGEEGRHLFCLQSLSNVLLPIALHPVYESKTKDEEPLAIEAVATVGAISRHLSWSKYSSLLWTSLTQFHRHPEQERYLLAMICAIIDGFHFELWMPNNSEEAQEGTEGTDTSKNATAVWRALEKRFVPKLESLLTKETVDKNGTKLKSLRASLILALVKLFQKCSKSMLETRLPRLLTVICSGLKERDSDTRDVARSTLAKVVVDIDMAYLPDVLREVAISLNTGFRLNVRIATVHSILLALSATYSPPPECTNEEAQNLPFDRSVPALMDIIQEDLFGEAQERKDAEGVQGRYVKEAAGSKSHNALELVSSLIVFRPSMAKNLANSSIHAVVSPFVERLKDQGIEVRTIRRIKECLSRVVSGLSRNPTMRLEEVLPYVHATASPFICTDDLEAAFSRNSDDISDDEENDQLKPINVSGSKQKELHPGKGSQSSGSVASWCPSSLKACSTSEDASNVKRNEAHGLRKLQDGVSAPRMTGSARYNAIISDVSTRINDPSNVGAVVFSLRLLYSVLKKKRLDKNDGKTVALIEPFVPLLTICVCTCKETDVVLLAIRCLSFFLSCDVPSKDICAKPLGSKTLELLSSSGVASNQNTELVQACFKMLILLMNDDRSPTQGQSNDPSTTLLVGENVLSSSNLPLDGAQMRILLSFLQESIIDSDNHNAALNLVKTIMSRRFISVEFYDLMDNIIELSVRSHKAPLRQQCCGIAINFLLNYPIGEERLQQHLKQIVLNAKYEHEEGRLSGINLVTIVVEKLPQQVLEKHVQLFFLPLTLQLVNDDSTSCRQAVAKCLARLLKRLSSDVLKSLYDIACRWSQGASEVRRASLQLFSIFVDTRAEFLKGGGLDLLLLDRLEEITLDLEPIKDAEWEILYFSLTCLEKLMLAFFKRTAARYNLWKIVIESLAHSHPFVKKVSSRLINQYFESLGSTGFGNSRSEEGFLSERPGSMYEIARNICFQLNAEEDHQSEDLVAIDVKSLCWLVPAMHRYPSLCYADKETDEANGSRKDPVSWLMNRLSNIAKPQGSKRRQAVFKAFAAIATVCPNIVLPRHLELMLEPLHRVDVEASSDVDKSSLTGAVQQCKKRNSRQPVDHGQIPAEAVLARDVLQLLEEKCDTPEVFLQAYGAVRVRARERKENRKTLVTSEAIRDPRAAAKRRQEENEREKKRKKRKVEERRRERGAMAKGHNGYR